MTSLLTYPLGNNFRSCLLFYLLSGVTSPGVVGPAWLGRGVVGLVVVLGVTTTTSTTNTTSTTILEQREVLGARGASVEEISVEVRVVPKAHGTLASAGLTGRSARTLTSVEARPLGFSIVVPWHFIGVPLLSDFLWIPAHT